MENIEKIGQYYTHMLKTICGADYEKVQAASQAASVENDGFCDDLFNGLQEIKARVVKSKASKPRKQI